MTQLIAPDLQRKWEFLIDRRVCVDKEEIARALGKSVKTLNWWAHGGTTRAPGTIPKDSKQAVLALFARCFPDGTPLPQVELALGLNFRDFEAALDEASSLDWETFVARYADKTAGSLYLATTDTGLVEIEADTEPTTPCVPVGVWFRIVFKTDFDGPHVIGLQCAHGALGMVQASVNLEDGLILLPGRRPNGDPAQMRERRDVGENEFVALQLSAPLPQNLSARLIDRNIVDIAALDSLAAYLVDKPDGTWRLFSFHLTVENESKQR